MSAVRRQRNKSSECQNFYISPPKRGNSTPNRYMHTGNVKQALPEAIRSDMFVSLSSGDVKHPFEENKRVPQRCSSEPVWRPVTATSGMKKILANSGTNETCAVKGDNMMTFLRNIWKHDILCDVYIRVGDEGVWAHKLLLVAHSELLASKLLQGQSECKTSQITLHKSELKDVETVLGYIYTSDIKINSTNVGGILTCAEELGVEEIVRMCEGFLSDFSVKTALGFFTITEKHNLVNIHRKLYTFVCNNFTDISKSEEFLRSDASTVCRLLEDDNIMVKNELTVFKSAQRWIEYNKQERIADMVQVMRRVRFKLISLEDIATQVESVEYLFENKDCREMLYKAFRYQALKQQGSSLADLIHVPNQRRWTGSKTPIHYEQPSRDNTDGADMRRWTGRKAPTQCEHPPRDDANDWSDAAVYGERHAERTKRPTDKPSKTLSWDTGIQAPVTKSSSTTRKPRVRSASSAPNIRHNGARSLLVFGGIELSRDADQPTGDVIQKYDLTTNQWEAWSSMPEPRHHHAVVTLNDYVYILGGGYSNDKTQTSTNMVYRYHMTTKEWSHVSSMKRRRIFLAATVMRGRIYVVGGADIDNRPADSMEYYIPETDRWVVGPPLSCPRVGSSAVGHHGLLYVAGGYAERRRGCHVLDNFECFDPVRNSWTTKEHLPYPRCHANLESVDSRLYLIGGATQSNSRAQDICSIAAIDVYNSEEDLWEFVADLSTPRHDAACTVVGPYIFIMGGVSSVEGACLSSVERFDVTNGEVYDDTPPLLIAVAGTACCHAHA